MIHNLKPAIKLVTNVKNLKHKEAGDDDPNMVDFTDELQCLKEHLACATHSGWWCFVSPIDGNHNQLDIFVLTLWAKKMVTPPKPALLPSDDDNDGLIKYPAIELLLCDLDEVMPAVNFLQYQTAFIGHGIFYVDSIKDLSPEFLEGEIGLPQSVVKWFKKYAGWFMRCAEKQKGRAPTEIIDLVEVVKQAHQKENVEYICHCHVNVV
ncbi:hypothetical protein F5141DRAFT_1061639 [Pisolithus sp. B1]|nr:hypothetical protein F5141DRAFT_1061639 [Pisolithus sp. B1]